MNVHSFSIKNIFNDKMNLGLFYFHVTKGILKNTHPTVLKDPEIYNTNQAL